MSFKERAEILSAIKGVSRVVEASDSDNTVCETLATIKPKWFGNGGDRKENNTPEMSLCKELNIDMVWNLGGGKIQSSSELVAKTKS